MQDKLKYYFYVNSVSCSILLNTITGGDQYQTFSARNWERRKAGKWNCVSFIDKLIWFEEDHCMNCWIRWKLGMYAMRQHDEEVNEDVFVRQSENNTS